MVHAADFGRLRDQCARSPALQMLIHEAGVLDITLRRDWAVLRSIEGMERRVGGSREASAPAIADLANKNFHACVALPASHGHTELSDEACRMAETAPTDVLHIEWVVADSSTNVIDAGEMRVTGRIRQGRGCT